MRGGRIGGYPTRSSLCVARHPIAVCVNPLACPPSARRILVIRLGALGDVVRTLPAASALRAAFPNARISWLVEARAAEAIEGQPWVDDILLFPRAALARMLRAGHLGALLAEARRTVRTLRRRRFDLVLDFHAILRSAVLARMSGAPIRVGYAAPFGRELSPLFATHRARLRGTRLSRFERNLGLVEFLGVSANPDTASLRVDPAARLRMRETLGGAAPVAIHAGSSDATPHKRFGVAAFARVARELAPEYGPALVTAGPGAVERARAAAVVAAAGGAARFAPPTPHLRDLAALLSLCRLCIGSDTGPLHVAALVGTPVVQLFGPTDPVVNATHPGAPSRALRAGLACSPCRRGCAAAPCMERIAPAAIVEAACELLAGGASGAGATRALRGLG